MSDQWTLCPKCKGEVEKIVSDHELWKCPNCNEVWFRDELIVESTEYFNDKIPDGFGGNLEFTDKGEEDEKSNQSRRSKK